jgi:phage terminase large subunit-like protein
VPAWDLSCPDWEQRLRTGRLPFRSLPLTPHGDRAVAAYDRLRLADVDGTPRLGPRLEDDPPEQRGDASGDWFREIVRAMFGGWDPITRERYIRELFALVPKKNSKTTYGALGLMLVALLLNERPRAPFLMTAPVQDTAEMAFSAVAGAIELDPVLAAKLHVRDHLKTIVHRETKAELEIITFDPAVVTGRKVVGLLIDEVHVLGKVARASKALLQLRGGMQPFPEAFLAMITTQSDEAPAGVFKAELEKAREIRDGKRAGSMLPVLYEFPAAMQTDPAMPWRDPANWHIVTPNLGRSIHLHRLIDECADEEAKGEGELRTWASQHLNIEIGLALHSNRWVGADYWEQCAEPALTLEALLERSDVVTVGIDGGGMEDLLGFAALGREIETGRWLHWGKAWVHRIVLEERRKQIASVLEDFAADGDLVILEDDDASDVEQVADLVAQIEAAGLLDRVGVDAHGIDEITEAIVRRKIAFDRIVGIPQGWKLVGPLKSTERRLAQKRFVHCGRRMMAWSVSNAKVEPAGNAVKVTKQAAGTAKIDPVMAIFDAAALMMENPKARRTQPILLFA